MKYHGNCEKKGDKSMTLPVEKQTTKNTQMTVYCHTQYCVFTIRGDNFVLSTFPGIAGD